MNNYRVRIIYNVDHIADSILIVYKPTNMIIKRYSINQPDIFSKLWILHCSN